MKENQSFKRMNSCGIKVQKLSDKVDTVLSVEQDHQINKQFSNFAQGVSVNNLLKSLEFMMSKFEVAIDKQNSKMIEFQSKLTDNMISKFDQVIHYNKRISEGIERLTDLRPSQIPNTQTVASPRLQDFFKDKKEGSLKQSIIGLNRTMPLEQNQKALNILPPLPTLDQSIILSTSKSYMAKKNVFVENTNNFINYGKTESIKSNDTVQEVAVTLAHHSPVQQQSSKINEWIGNFYTNTTSYYFEQYSSGKLNYQDMKIKFCGDILNELLTLSSKWDQLMGVSKQQKLAQRRNKFYHIYTDASKRALQFQIDKYPPSRRKKIDSQLSQRIKPMNNISVIKHDILKNAKMEIGLNQKQTDFTKQIKVLLNKLIIQTNNEFPTFKEVMKKIFLQQDSQKSIEGKIQNEVEFVIGRKIPDGVSLYSNEELQTPGLQLKTPQSLRILVKWCEELLSYFLNPEQKIYGNKFGFKNIKAGALPIKIPKSRLQQLVTNLQKIFRDEVKPIQRQQYDNIGNLIMDLINISIDGVNGYEFLNKRQITIAKLSQYLNDSLKSYVLVFLNLMLKNLVKIRGFYEDKKLEANIHLVTFGIMDLLRCKCIGSKTNIYRIYNQILKRKDYFEIIRIKNKLNQSTRDIIINLKLKNSFLICQIQLSLGEVQQQVNDHFCHFLYELQRTNFGVLFECASQISNLDPRMNYIKKQKSLMFKGSSKRIAQIIKSIKTYQDKCACGNGHKQIQMEVVSNNRPYCCSLCTKFISSYTLCLKLFKCSICSTTLCPECIIMMNRSNKAFVQKYTFLNKDELNTTSNFFYQHHQYQGMCESDIARNKIPNYLQKNSYVLHIIANNVGYKKTLYKRFKNSYTQTFSTLPQLNNYSSSKYCWNSIIALKPCQKKNLSQLNDYNKFHISLEWSQLEQIFEKNNIKEVVCVIDSETKSVLIVDIFQTQQQIQEYKLYHQIQTIVEETNINHQQFLQLTSKNMQSLEQLQKVEDKNSIKILNLWENKIKNINILSKFSQVKELFLRQNQIESLDPILQMNQLELAFISDNKIKGPLPKMNFPLLNAFDMSLNDITDLNNITVSSLDSLAFFRMVSTKIKVIPIMNLPKLQVFWFDHNQITNFNNLVNSKVPQLMKVSLSRNFITGQLPELRFQKLQNLLLNYNQISSINSLSTSQCPNLKSLSLHHNIISGPLPLMSFLSLCKIDLSNNKISSLPEMFNSQRLRCLEIIDLKCNQIKGSLPIFQLEFLKRIDLSNNFISNIDNLSKSKMPSLKYIDVSKNNVAGSLPILRFIKLQQLNLSNNQIISIQNLSSSKLPRLRVLRCDYNRVCTLIPRMYMQNMQILQLSCNSIIGQQFIKDIHLLPSLKKVYLKGNPQSLKTSIYQKCDIKYLKIMQFQDNYLNKSLQ